MVRWGNSLSNHDLLLNKLVPLNKDITWFASYLHDRTHSVSYHADDRTLKK